MNESMDRVLADWLREGPEQGPREGLERALAATRRAGQKPGWALPERWIPMQLTMARTPSLRPILAIVLVALLTLALVAAALFIGSQRRPVPPPFGPARNGAIVYGEAGDLFIADDLSGEARTLISGPDDDINPVFSNQGDRIAFARAVEGGFQVMSVLPDGSGLQSLAQFPGEVERIAWSPSGDAMLVNYTESGPSGFRLASIDTDGSSPTLLDVGFPVDWVSWRPNGEQIVFRGTQDDGTAGAFVANPDGTGIRQLAIESTGQVDFEGLGWSPDGNHLGFMSGGELGGVDGWQLNIADINAAGALTELHQLRLDPESEGEHLPAWSPDSSQIAFLQQKDFRRQVGLFNADGSGYRLVGPDTKESNILGYTWAPDGKTLLITEVPDYFPAREKLRKMYSVDVATGEYTEVQNPVGTWQRQAP